MQAHEEEDTMRVAVVVTADPVCCSPGHDRPASGVTHGQHDCGCLPVVDDDDRVSGVVTDRDIACKCAGLGKDASTPVAEVMTSQSRCCGPDDDVCEATRIMSEAQVRRVPVVDDGGCCVGMLAQADVAAADQQAGESRTGVTVETCLDL